MIEKGRTMREAIDAGNAFQIRWSKPDGTWDGEYFPPAATEPEEVIVWAAERGSDGRDEPGSYLGPCAGTTVEIQRHLRGSSIGATVVKRVGSYTYPEWTGDRASWLEAVRRSLLPWPEQAREGVTADRERTQ